MAVLVLAFILIFLSQLPMAHKMIVYPSSCFNFVELEATIEAMLEKVESGENAMQEWLAEVCNVH